MASGVRLQPAHGRPYTSSVQLIRLTSLPEVQLHTVPRDEKKKRETLTRSRFYISDRRLWQHSNFYIVIVAVAFNPVASGCWMGFQETEPSTLIVRFDPFLKSHPVILFAHDSHHSSTLSISCHVWLPSVVTDNTVGSTTANWPINGLLANGRMVARHATFYFDQSKLFYRQEFSKRMCQKTPFVLFLSSSNFSPPYWLKMSDILTKHRGNIRRA